jgi:hypothetical protein
MILPKGHPPGFKIVLYSKIQPGQRTKKLHERMAGDRIGGEQRWDWGVTPWHCPPEQEVAPPSGL